MQVIELIRQFYDTQRQFRIIGASGMEEYVSYSNANIAPMAQGSDFSIDMGFRKPLFDLQVSAQKQSPYSKMSQNELALQFYNAGFFNPAMADQALMCLDMMDFDRKSAVMDKIRQNSQMFMIMQQMMMDAPIPNGEASADETEALGGNPAEPKHVEDAKKKVADSTSPV